MVKQIKRNPLGWELYNTMLTELNLAVIGSFINYKDSNKKENLSIAFCFFNQDDGNCIWSLVYDKNFKLKPF